jgi:O-methyltransferase domain
MPPQAALLQLFFGKQIAYCLSAVASLGVADHMGRTPVSVDALSEKVGAHAPSLYRVMRLLAGAGVFEELPEKRFALTPLSELLKTDAEGSLRYLAIIWGEDWSTRAMAEIEGCVRSGRDGVTAVFGKNIFEVFAEHPDWARKFQRAMSSFSASAGPAVVKAYDFSEIRRLADVGGGHGMLLASILKQYPSMHGVLFDLPEVIAGAPSSNHFDGCNGRVQMEPGTFFERVPSGCDAYLLKHIIHDWSDEHCRKILSLVRDQLPTGGRVLLCEMVVPAEPGMVPSKALDIEMLVMTPGGKERTRQEFAELFASAGLRLVRVVPTDGPLCVLEARSA